MGYTLKNIIQEYLIEIGDSQFNKYPRYYQLGVSALRELNMNASSVMKSIDMPIKVNSTCDLPLDYLMYSKIGLVGSDGCIHSLGQNDCQSFLQSYTDCGEPQKLILEPTVATSTASPFGGVSTLNNYGNNYRNGEFMGRMFGINGGLNGYGNFRIDRENQLILVSNLAIGTLSVAMEYMADVSLSDGDFEVHPYIIESIKAYVYWKAIQRDRGRGNGEKQIAERDYNNAARWAKNRYTSSTIQEWKEAFRSGNSAAVKW